MIAAGKLLFERKPRKSSSDPVDAEHSADFKDDFSANPVQSARKTMFEVIREETFRDASLPNNTVPRRAFTNETLEGWEKGTMLSDEDRLVLGRLYRDASSVIEFGLGESTKIAAYVGVPRYVGVDSDAAWISTARAESRMDHFRFFFADIGKTRQVGHPVDNRLKKIPYDYQIMPLVGETEAFDVYVIDGRYRIACACVSLLHALSCNGDMEKIRFAFHDYSRQMYHAFEAVADVVIRTPPTPQNSGALGVLKAKRNVTEEEIYKLWEANRWENW